MEKEIEDYIDLIENIMFYATGIVIIISIITGILTKIIWFASIAIISTLVYILITIILIKIRKKIGDIFFKDWIYQLFKLNKE